MKIGDYVRTNNGLIFKIVGGNEDNWKLDIEYSKLEYMEDTWLELYRYNDNAGWFIPEHCKSSPDIIDLIEYGDIVKYKIDDEIFISEVWGEKNNYFIRYFDIIKDLRDLNIVSIITKEQFESMEYKVGEDIKEIPQFEGTLEQLDKLSIRGEDNENYKTTYN